MASQLTWNKHEPKTKRLTACFETCQFAVARGKVEGNNCRKFQNISDFPRASNHTNRLLIDIFVKNFPKRTGAQLFFVQLFGTESTLASVFDLSRHRTVPAPSPKFNRDASSKCHISGHATAAKHLQTGTPLG